MTWTPEEDEARRKREEHQAEVLLAYAHDCINDRVNCDTIHPNTERMVFAQPSIERNQERKPPNWRNWLLSPKVGIQYINQHTLRLESFNLSEAFAQMNSNGKLNVIHLIIEHCLSNDERSMLFSDLNNA